MDLNTRFDGVATIKVRFQNKAEYEKFRKYILKTNWSYDLDHPMWEQLTMEFHCSEDVDKISRQIVALLQMGFEVYSCRYQLESQLAEEEHPPEDNAEDDDFFVWTPEGDVIRI